MNWLLLLLPIPVTIAGLTAYLSLRVWKHKKSFSEIKNPPPGPPEQSWLLGNLGMLPKDNKIYKLTEELFQTYGKIFRLRIIDNTWIIVSDYELIKKIALSRSFDMSSMTSAAFKDVFGEYVMLALTGDTWKRHRKLITPLFTQSRLKKFSNFMFEKHFDRLVEILRKESSKESIEIGEYLKRTALDIVAEAILGYNLNSLGDPSNPTTTAARVLLGMMPKTMLPFYKYIHPFEYRELVQARTYLRNLVEKMLQNYDNNPNKEGDLLNLMLGATDEETGEKLSKKEVLDETVTFIFAGYETSAGTISWILYYLCQYPNVQKKLQEEIDRVLGKRNPDMEDFEKLPYLTYIVKEVNRLSPVATQSARECIEPVQLGGYDVPKGATVLLNFLSVNLSPEYWENPRQFIPERWEALKQNTTQETEGKAKEVFPFGYGFRQCAGMKFAELELKVAVIKLFQNFSFELDKSKKFTSINMLIHTPEDLYLKITPRV